MNKSQNTTIDIASGILVNLLIIGTLVYAIILQSLNIDFFYLSVQEDQYIEWSSFWAFIGASIIYLMIIFRLWKEGRPPWFVMALAALCFFIAMEEISWGQRIIGYQPSDHFLKENFQQEFNIHNFASARLRGLVLHTIILGFGVVLPLAGLVPAVRRFFQRFAVLVPPFSLAPAFLTAFFADLLDPLNYTREWVELMLGLGFFFASLYCIYAYRFAVQDSRWISRLSALIPACWLIIAGMGAATAAMTWSESASELKKINITNIELEALKEDILGGGNFMSGWMSTKCGIHKRIYSYVEKYRERHLLAGRFAQLTDGKLPKKRAVFFLDPWYFPYWIHNRCTDDGRSVSIYSFGPNKRRESTHLEVKGDDIALFVEERKKKRTNK